MKNNSEFKIGQLVTLKGRPQTTGLISEIVLKKVDNSPVDLVYLYRVFWFTGTGSSKLYAAVELTLNEEPDNEEEKAH